MGHNASIFSEADIKYSKALKLNYPRITYLHGKHTGYRLLNTKNDISEFINPDMKDAFEDRIANSNLIVLGYSGWDDVATKSLETWIDRNQEMRGIIYWVPWKNETELSDKTSCLLYTSPSPRDATLSRMPSSA